MEIFSIFFQIIPNNFPIILSVATQKVLADLLGFQRIVNGF